jgi:hypothetical protein
MFGLGLGKLGVIASAIRAWLPSTLFANNEPGVWYDPSDTSTLFQDAAGTTPVTAVEQPVGLMLDKSRGLVLGSELVTNGTFDTGISGWTDISSTGGSIAWNASGYLDLVCATGAAWANTSFTTVAGKTYRLSFNVVTSDNVQIYIGTAAGGTQILGATTIAGSSSHTRTFVAINTTAHISFREPTVGVTTSIDNVSVRELPGNHAFQSVATTSRPVLSARYNLLTKTEQFADGAWLKSNINLAGAKVSPTGSSTAFELTATTSLAVLRATLTLSQADNYNFSIWLRRVSGSGVIGISCHTGGTYSNVTPTAEWQLFSVTQTITAGVRTPGLRISTSGDVIEAWGASLVPTNQASLPYQRVNTSTDYDADPTKFPRYLRFDGSDDWLQTNTITPGTDKAQVFAGVRKLSDATVGVPVELSQAIDSNAGSFVFAAPANNNLGNYFFSSRGSVSAPTYTPTSNIYFAPITNVITGLGDISGDSSTLRVNGTQATSNAGDQGTGNYGNYPLYIGRRGGTTLPFNGHIHQLIVRFGPNLDAATITNAEKFVGTKTGITL